MDQDIKAKMLRVNSETADEAKDMLLCIFMILAALSSASAVAFDSFIIGAVGVTFAMAMLIASRSAVALKSRLDKSRIGDLHCRRRELTNTHISLA